MLFSYTLQGDTAERVTHIAGSPKPTSRPHPSVSFSLGSCSFWWCVKHESSVASPGTRGEDMARQRPAFRLYASYNERW